MQAAPQLAQRQTAEAAPPLMPTPPPLLLVTPSPVLGAAPTSPTVVPLPPVSQLLKV